MVDEYGSKGLYLDLAEHLDDMPNYKSYLDKDPQSQSTLDEVYDVAKAIKDAGVSKYPIRSAGRVAEPRGCGLQQLITPLPTVTMTEPSSNMARFPMITKQALQYLNKIYTEGLISPDYFTYTTDMGNADLESGTACILPLCMGRLSRSLG